LGREFVDARVRAAGAQRRTARAQLGSRSVGPRLGAQSLERREGVAKLPPRVDASAGAA
jgi:hypothetical protein